MLAAIMGAASDKQVNAIQSAHLGNLNMNGRKKLMCKGGLTKKAEPPPTRDVNRDSGTDSANGGWLRSIVRRHSHLAHDGLARLRISWYNLSNAPLSSSYKNPPSPAKSLPSNGTEAI